MEKGEGSKTIDTTLLLAVYARHRLGGGISTQGAFQHAGLSLLATAPITSPITTRYRVHSPSADLDSSGSFPLPY